MGTSNLERIQGKATNASPGCEMWDKRYGMLTGGLVTEKISDGSHIAHGKLRIFNRGCTEQRIMVDELKGWNVN